MFEICALLSQPKPRKARKPSAPRITVGAIVKVLDSEGVVVGRDAKYANAWTIRFPNGKEMSFSRDMIQIGVEG